ncbi:MAG: Crp/Fnr family transcriptional regulator [Candidatus Binataceae bacterium]
MKLNPNRNYTDAFSQLRSNLTRWGIPPEFTDEIVECSLAVNFEKGVLVLSEGSTNDLFGCVLSGFVKVYCAVADGNRTLVRLVGPGELIGYADYIDARDRHAQLFEAQSSSKCSVALINRDHVARLLRGFETDALVELLQTLNTFWSQNLRWFATLLNLPFGQRLEVVLNDLALRFGVKDSRGTILIPELAHEDLAEMIGCSRPMVSRLIAEMAEGGLLSRSGKQYLLLNQWNFGENENLSQVSSQVQASVSLRAAKLGRRQKVTRLDPPPLVPCTRAHGAAAGR